MCTLLLDIETAPLGWDQPTAPGSLWERALEDAKRAAETDPPPSNYKKPEAIERWRAERIAGVPDAAMKAYEQHSVKGDTCQIVTIVLQDPELGGPVAIHHPRDEAEVLRELYRQLRARAVDLRPGEQLRIVAWHGHSFDFPILSRRFATVGEWGLASAFWMNLDYGQRMQLGRLDDSPFQLVDAARLYPKVRGDRTRLRDMDTDDMQARDPLKGDGGKVLPALLEGRDEDVKQHCIVDVEDRLMTVWVETVWPLLKARGAS